ncbi:hypothetical protein K502DRAFT_341760 [Neoconidiobolus thromboides FSU 785]|nr:hypothetical protein K502DRAFT_341760 [Neoconidiobolus thromboides FSU 785]
MKFNILVYLLFFVAIHCEDWVKDDKGNNLNIQQTQPQEKDTSFNSDPTINNNVPLLEKMIQPEDHNTIITTHDPCIDINNYNQTYTYDQILNCYNSFPFDPKIRDGVLDTLWKLLPFYVFSDVARKRSVDAIKGGKTIDMETMLAVLRVKNYTKDRLFHKDISDLFLELRDGHTIYLPKCYSSFQFLLPFPLVLIEKDEKLIVKVKGGLPYLEREIETWKSMGVNVSEFDNAIVEKIDNKEAIIAIEEIADTRYGTSRDPHSRMNGALSSFKLINGTWKWDFGAFVEANLPPKKSHVLFEFNINGNKVVLNVPYLARAVYQGEFKDGKSYYELLCKNHRKDYNEEVKELQQFENERVEMQKKEEIELKKIINMDIKLNEVQLKSINQNQINLKVPILDGQFVKFYIFNKNIGIIAMNNFDSSCNDFLFKKEYIIGFKLFQKYKVEKLILDLSNNPGGVVCHGYSILKYLLPRSLFKPFLLDMHLNPILINLLIIDNTAGSPFNPMDKYNKNHTKYRDVTELLPKGEERWDVENRYTNFFYNDCESEDFLSNLKKDPEFIPFNLNDITLVTNSICYSTCGLFVNSLQELTNTITYSIGGSKMISNRKPTAGSMNGANVLPYSSLLSMLSYFNLTDHPLAPKDFPVQAGFSMTLMQAYSHFPDKKGLPIPLEFLARPAKRHFYYDEDTINHPEDVWLKIAKDRNYINSHRKVKKILSHLSDMFKSLFVMPIKK